jgi:hypothetical protein
MKNVAYTNKGVYAIQIIIYHTSIKLAKQSDMNACQKFHSGCITAKPGTNMCNLGYSKSSSEHFALSNSWDGISAQ